MYCMYSELSKSNTFTTKKWFGLERFCMYSEYGGQGFENIHFREGSRLKRVQFREVSLTYQHTYCTYQH